MRSHRRWSTSRDDLMDERFDPVPEPNLNSIPSVLANSRMDSIVSSTELMKQAEHCGLFSNPQFEPDGAVERAVLVHEQVLEVGDERLAAFLSDEILHASRPVVDLGHHATDQLADAVLASGGSPARPGSTCSPRCWWPVVTTTSGLPRRLAGRRSLLPSRSRSLPLGFPIRSRRTGRPLWMRTVRSRRARWAPVVPGRGVRGRSVQPCFVRFFGTRFSAVAGLCEAWKPFLEHALATCADDCVRFVDARFSGARVQDVVVRHALVPSVVPWPTV